MISKSLLKMMGLLPFGPYLLVTQIWKMAYEVRFAILISFVLLAFTSVVLAKREDTENGKYMYLIVSVAVIVTALAFSYQYFGN